MMLIGQPMRYGVSVMQSRFSDALSSRFGDVPAVEVGTGSAWIDGSQSRFGDVPAVELVLPG